MIRRLSLCGIAVGLNCLGAPSVQCQSQIIQEILNKVDLDSLRLTVQVLSGEVGSRNDGNTDTIRSRVYSSSTHDLAAEFLKTKLESYGLSAQLQAYTIPYLEESGINVLAEQTGSSGQSPKYILCAHYDAISDSGIFAPAPGADDNASGCAAVLEAARLLSQYRTTYTIVYALWDQEEVGTLGSGYYANAAAARGDTILGVVNLDMLGWDGNNDGLMEVHGSTTGNSNHLADTVALVSRLYQLPLNPIVRIPGTGSSDHSSFGGNGYGAVLCIEAFWARDFNPHYHSAQDRLQYFNLSYFHNLARLAAGSIALLAGIEGPVAVRGQNPLPGVFALDQNYPNPFNPLTTIRYGLAYRSHVTMMVFNTLGQQIAVLQNGDQEAGYHEVKFDGSGLSSGVYFYRIQVRPLDSAIGRDPESGAGSFVETKTLLLVR